MLLVKFKGLLTRDDASNSEGTSYHEFEKKKSLNIFRLSFLEWEPKRGNNIYLTVLSSATRLESPKSLAWDRASFLDSFSSIG